MPPSLHSLRSSVTTWSEVIVLWSRNWRLGRSSGKHVVKMTKPGHRPITLPHDKGGGGYPIGLTIAIMRQAGLRGGDE